MDYGIFWRELMGTTLPFDETEKVICKECRSYNRSREKLQRMKDWTIDKRKKRSKKWYWTQWKGNLASGSCGWSSERLRKKKTKEDWKIFAQHGCQRSCGRPIFFISSLISPVLFMIICFQTFDLLCVREKVMKVREERERESSTKLAWLPRWCGKKKGKRGESKKEKW